MLQKVADFQTPDGHLLIERILSDYMVDPGEPSRVISVSASLNGAMISRDRAEELLSASVTAVRGDGSRYRVTLSDDGSVTEAAE